MNQNLNTMSRQNQSNSNSKSEVYKVFTTIHQNLETGASHIWKQYREFIWRNYIRKQSN